MFYQNLLSSQLTTKLKLAQQDRYIQDCLGTIGVTISLARYAENKKECSYVKLRCNEEQTKTTCRNRVSVAS
jgi:hypothetical protein